MDYYNRKKILNNKYIIKTYYSQREEDILLNNMIFKNKKNGIYVELGALDGVLYSNTKFFEDKLNWRGILIEPHPLKFINLQKNRPNNYLFNDLVSCYSEPLKFRYFIDGLAAVSGVENTLSQHHFDNYYNKKMKTEQNSKFIIPRTLTSIIKTTNITHIDLLSLDVEGHEYEVLLSWDFSIPIDVILIEMLGVQPNKDELCRQILIKNKYICKYKWGKNEIFILEH
jgi:FkbM family methyltransferase